MKLIKDFLASWWASPLSNKLWQVFRFWTMPTGIVIGFILAGFINYQVNYQTLTHSQIRDCERELPRTEHCEMIAAPVKK